MQSNFWSNRCCPSICLTSKFLFAIRPCHFQQFLVSIINYVLLFIIPFQNILTVSSKLDSVEKLLDEKTRELSQTPVERQQQIKGEIDVLLSNRDKIQKQRIILEEKLQEGRLLSPVEERRYYTFSYPEQANLTRCVSVVLDFPVWYSLLIRWF